MNNKSPGTERSKQVAKERWRTSHSQFSRNFLLTAYEKNSIPENSSHGDDLRTKVSWTDGQRH